MSFCQSKGCSEIKAERDQLQREVSEGDEAIEELDARCLRVAKEAVDAMADRDRWRTLAHGMMEKCKVLRASIVGMYYLGEEKEIEIIDALLASYDAATQKEPK